MDLYYTNLGLFTLFIPNSKAGEEAWRELAEQTSGTGKVLTWQAKHVVKRLKAAGYTVRRKRYKAPSYAEIAAILEEL